MLPLLAPLIGSLAGSLLPATLGTGIAASLGLKGAAAGLLAAAAPKAIGAGIGTLVAGGDLGEAALNAVGFGAMGAGLGGAGAAGSAAPATSLRPMLRPEGLASAVGSAAPATSLRPMLRPEGLASAVGSAAPAAAVSPAVPTGATEAAANIGNLSRSAQQLAQVIGGGRQPQPNMSVASVNRPPQQRDSENPMLASMFNTAPTPQSSIPTTTVPVSSGPSMMPASVGIGSLQPMNNMFAGMSPDQSNMVNDYLRSRNLVGFA